VIVLALAVIVVALYLIGSHGNGNGGTTTPITSTVAQHHGTTPGQNNTTTGSGSHTTTTRPHTTTAPPPPVKATFALVATGTVWVCVENQAGKVLVPGVIYTDGQKIPTKTGKTLLVGLGNSHADLTVNGKPYTPAGSAAIGLKITPHAGATSLTPGPTCNE
jgi:uncharacterized protein DUF4115